jgi:hypothetical protein
MIKHEKHLEKLILSNMNMIFPENKKKGKLAIDIITDLAFFDRETYKMEK